MKKIRLTKKTAVIAAAAVITLGVGGFYVYKTQIADPGPQPVNPINYDPPTEEEKKQAEDNKQRIVDEQNAPKTTGKKEVTPVITNASQLTQTITINAYVSGIFEDGGTCTATITQGSQTLVKTSQSFANASTTDCSPIRIDRSEFPSGGDWQVVIAYDSSAATGRSQSKTLALQ